MRPRQEILDEASIWLDKPILEQTDLIQVQRLLLEVLLDIRDDLAHAIRKPRYELVPRTGLES